MAYERQKPVDDHLVHPDRHRRMVRSGVFPAVLDHPGNRCWCGSVPIFLSASTLESAAEARQNGNSPIERHSTDIWREEANHEEEKCEAAHHPRQQEGRR